MKGSEFAFDYVHLLYYKCHKINPNCWGSYIDSPDWIKSKTNNAKINPIKEKTKGNNYFQFAVTVTLNYEELKKDSESKSKRLAKESIRKRLLEKI